jgi:hypothetical protein
VAGIGDTIKLPGVPPTDKDGHSAEFDRQLVTTLAQFKAAIVQLESIINTRRI